MEQEIKEDMPALQTPDGKLTNAGKQVLSWIGLEELIDDKGLPQKAKQWEDQKRKLQEELGLLDVEEKDSE